MKVIDRLAHDLCEALPTSGFWVRNLTCCALYRLRARMSKYFHPRILAVLTRTSS
jgi:hypothetical protein